MPPLNACGSSAMMSSAASAEAQDTSAIAQHLSARVELAITQVLGAETDELDGPSFDAIAFINKKFPDEQSLDGLERAISEFDSEIKGCVVAVRRRGGS